MLLAPSSVRSWSAGPFQVEVLKEEGKFVTALAVDANGQLWVGTEAEGVLMRNGDRWERIGAERIGEANCTALATTRDGSVWIGTGRRGLAVLRGKNQKQIGIMEGLPGVHVYALASDPASDRTIWCATEGGVCRLSLTQESEGVADVKVALAPLARDGLEVREFGSLTLHPESGALWAGAIIGGAACWDGHRWRLFAPAKNIGDQINAVRIDGMGRLWAATKHGPARLDLGSGQWHGYTINDVNGKPLPDPHCTTICEDGHGRLWAGTRRYGLWFYDSNKERWQTLGEKLPGAHISAMCKGAGNSLWIGLYGQGVCRIDANE